MVRKGTIIVFSENSPRLRPELKGCQAKFTSDYKPGNSTTAYLYIMNGELKGRNMQGTLRKEDYRLYIINKGRED